MKKGKHLFATAKGKDRRAATVAGVTITNRPRESKQVRKPTIGGNKEPKRATHPQFFPRAL